MFNQIGQGVRNGLSTVGQDLSFGAGLFRDQGKTNQQYNQLVAPQVAAMKAKKQNMATKMAKPAQPSYIDNVRGNIASNLTSPGRDKQYLQ